MQQQMLDLPPGLIVLVTGTREPGFYDLVQDTLAGMQPRMVIHGDENGVDSAAGHWARKNGVAEVKVPAQWHVYEKKAGPVRNEWMLLLRPDYVIAFPGPRSRGTFHMMESAERDGYPVINMTGETRA